MDGWRRTPLDEEENREDVEANKDVDEDDMDDEEAEDKLEEVNEGFVEPNNETTGASETEELVLDEDKVDDELSDNWLIFVSNYSKIQKQCTWEFKSLTCEGFVELVGFLRACTFMGSKSSVTVAPDVSATSRVGSELPGFKPNAEKTLSEGFKVESSFAG